MALTALGTVLGFGVLGGGAAYAMTSGHSQAATPAATRTIQPSGCKVSGVRSRPGLLRCRGSRDQPQNIAQTTFPVSLGVV